MTRQCASVDRLKKLQYFSGSTGKFTLPHLLHRCPIVLLCTRINSFLPEGPELHSAAKASTRSYTYYFMRSSSRISLWFLKLLQWSLELVVSRGGLLHSQLQRRPKESKSVLLVSFHCFLRAMLFFALAYCFSNNCSQKSMAEWWPPLYNLTLSIRSGLPATTSCWTGRIITRGTHCPQFDRQVAIGQKISVDYHFFRR